MSTAQGDRRLLLQSSRAALCSLPADKCFEIPGRPNVIYQLREYSSPNSGGAAQAREDVPFLFKAFETGQIGPKRLAKMHGGKAKVRTIHEYLDWTVTENSAFDDDELDFGGFRVIVLLPRYRSQWPPPPPPPAVSAAVGDAAATAGPLLPPPSEPAASRQFPELGAPLDPLPVLQSHGKPLSAATIRSGPDYIEVPFVATHESKRGRGHGRALLEAMEDVARALKLRRLLLCSTNDKGVQETWEHLGLTVSSPEYLAATDVQEHDLVHMLHTTQMHKEVLPRRPFRPVLIRHQRFLQRTYALAGPISDADATTGGGKAGRVEYLRQYRGPPAGGTYCSLTAYGSTQYTGDGGGRPSYSEAISQGSGLLGCAQSESEAGPSLMTGLTGVEGSNFGGRSDAWRDKLPPGRLAWPDLPQTSGASKPPEHSTAPNGHATSDAAPAAKRRAAAATATAAADSASTCPADCTGGALLEHASRAAPQQETGEPPPSSAPQHGQHDVVDLTTVSATVGADAEQVAACVADSAGTTAAAAADEAAAAAAALGTPPSSAEEALAADGLGTSAGSRQVPEQAHGGGEGGAAACAPSAAAEVKDEAMHDGEGAGAVHDDNRRGSSSQAQDTAGEQGLLGEAGGGTTAVVNAGAVPATAATAAATAASDAC